jgi:hypothetical protein
VDPVTPKPPVGAPAAAVSPPIVVPGPGAVAAAPTGPPVPQVESFDEETYRCKAGETFATISKQKYLTENYARALLVYNRNHPQAADALRQEPPVLPEGTMVFIPPVSILEKRYASMIPNLTPITPPSPPPPAATVSNAKPARPVVPPIGAGLEAATTYPQYKVVGRSEMMWEIARRARARASAAGDLPSEPELQGRVPDPGQRCAARFRWTPACPLRTCRSLDGARPLPRVPKTPPGAIVLKEGSSLARRANLLASGNVSPKRQRGFRFGKIAPGGVREPGA